MEIPPSIENNEDEDELEFFKPGENKTNESFDEDVELGLDVDTFISKLAENFKSDW